MRDDSNNHQWHPQGAGHLLRLAGLVTRPQRQPIRLAETPGGTIPRIGTPTPR